MKIKLMIFQAIIFNAMAVYIAIYWTVDFDSIRDYMYLFGLITYNLITMYSVTRELSLTSKQ